MGKARARELGLGSSPVWAILGEGLGRAPLPAYWQCGILAALQKPSTHLSTTLQEGASDSAHIPGGREFTTSVVRKSCQSPPVLHSLGKCGSHLLFQGSQTPTLGGFTMFCSQGLPLSHLSLSGKREALERDCLYLPLLLLLLLSRFSRVQLCTTP